MGRPRCCRPHAGRVVRATWSSGATRAEGIRWREEVVLVLRASELGVCWIVCLYAFPALGSHATAVDPLGHLVFGLSVLNALAAVGLELTEATTGRLPVVLAAAGQKKCERQNQ